MPTATWTHRHLLGLHDLSRGEIEFLLDRSEAYLPAAKGEVPGGGELTGRVIGNLFFEDSTRTRVGFTVAAQRLGASTIDLTGMGSSITKGETLTDTALNLEAMGVDAMVIRSSAAGAAVMIANAVQCPVINAGDGRHEHPTQGLLDIMTLRQRLGDLNGKTIAIVGDIANSRVARSAIYGLTKFGANVRLVGPATLVPKTFEQIVADGQDEKSLHKGWVKTGHDLDAILPEVDAVMMLRVQFERGSDIAGDYRSHYALTAERAAKLPPHAVVMHPGPMNRGLEVDGAVADDPQRSVILRQVANGVAVLMAVLATLLGH